MGYINRVFWGFDDSLSFGVANRQRHQISDKISLALSSIQLIAKGK